MPTYTRRIKRQSLYYLLLVCPSQMRLDVYVYMLAICLEEVGIQFVFNLFQGFIGTLVDFKLKDIDIVLGLHQQVDSSVAGRVFNVNIESQHLEDDVNGIVEVLLLIFDYLLFPTCKEAFKTFHECLGLACPDFFDEVGNEESFLVFTNGVVIGNQEFC